MKRRVKQDEEPDVPHTIMDATVAELAKALGIPLRLHRIDEPWRHPRGELMMRRFYCLAVPVDGQSDFLFPRTRNANEIKRTAATITDLIHMGFIKTEPLEEEDESELGAP